MLTLAIRLLGLQFFYPSDGNGQKFSTLRRPKSARVDFRTTLSRQGQRKGGYRLSFHIFPSRQGWYPSNEILIHICWNLSPAEEQKTLLVTIKNLVSLPHTVKRKVFGNWGFGFASTSADINDTRNFGQSHKNNNERSFDSNQPFCHAV